MRQVKIVVDDREDTTTVHLPEDYFGQVELSFRAGVLVNTKQTATRTKQELRAKPEARG
jgi:hypothetical protein